MTPEEITEQRFSRGAGRSKPYQEGFLAAAKRVAAGKRGEGPCPYTFGTTEYDAWQHGAHELIYLRRDQVTVTA